MVWQVIVSRPSGAKCHVGMSSDARDRGTETTVDHAEIRTWVSQRGGVPARAADDSDRRETLQIAFRDDEESGTVPTLDDEDIVEISWTRFFETFEDRNLAFRYRDESRYYEFVDRDETDTSGEVASDELLDDAIVVEAATGTEAIESGMDVIDVSEETERNVGVVSQVTGPRMYVDPDPGLTDKLKIKLGRGDTATDDDVYRVSELQIETVEDDVVRIYRPE